MTAGRGAPPAPCGAAPRPIAASHQRRISRSTGAQRQAGTQIKDTLSESPRRAVPGEPQPQSTFRVWEVAAFRGWDAEGMGGKNKEGLKIAQDSLGDVQGRNQRQAREGSR